MSGAWVYIDGTLVPREVAGTQVDDTALLYGRGLFETFRARHGAVYLLERHLARLRTGADFLGIEMPQTLADLASTVCDLTKRCELDDARVRLTLTGGSEGGPATAFMQAFPIASYPQRLLEQGAAVEVASVRRNETSPLSRIKSLNYLDNLLAKQEALKSGADEAILLNTQGRLAEGSGSNLFVVRGEELVTPAVADGALPGVTRAKILEIASEAGLSALEKPVEPSELRDAEEAFLTNAVVGVLPLTSFEHRAIGSGVPGSRTLRLCSLYQLYAGQVSAPCAR